MRSQTNKNFVIKKTAQMSFWGFVSRVMGIAREILQGQLLGVNDVSDSFLTSSGIPNMLRKIFEEGGITSALVPHLVRVVHDHGKKRGSELVSAVLIIFESVMLLCCVGVWVFPHQVVHFFAPGFGAAQVASTITFLRVMFPSALFFAGSNIIASGLHAINQFFLPAAGPAIYNAVYLLGIGGCLWYCLPVEILAWIMMLAGAAKFISRLLGYFWYGFSLPIPTKACLHDLGIVMRRFLPCLLSFGALEISILLDKRLTSFLPKGSVSLLYYAQRFGALPYSILAVALATVLLSHFSLAAVKNPKRLPFFFFESCKLATWFSLPLMAFMMFLALPLFGDLMLKGRATPAEIATAARLLTVLLCAFPLQAINKIMTSIFYAKNDTSTPMWTVIFSMLCATLCNYALIGKMGIFAMALGILINTGIKSLILMALLYYKHRVEFPFRLFARFLGRLVFQFLFGVCIFGFLYATLGQLLERTSVASFFSVGALGYWILVLLSFALTLLILWLSHRKFGLRLYLMPHYAD